MVDFESGARLNEAACLGIIMTCESTSNAATRTKEAPRGADVGPGGAAIGLYTCCM